MPNFGGRTPLLQFLEVSVHLGGCCLIRRNSFGGPIEVMQVAIKTFLNHQSP